MYRSLESIYASVSEVPLTGTLHFTGPAPRWESAERLRYASGGDVREGFVGGVQPRAPPPLNKPRRSRSSVSVKVNSSSRMSAGQIDDKLKGWWTRHVTGGFAKLKSAQSLQDVSVAAPCDEKKRTSRRFSLFKMAKIKEADDVIVDHQRARREELFADGDTETYSKPRKLLQSAPHHTGTSPPPIQPVSGRLINRPLSSGLIRPIPFKPSPPPPPITGGALNNNIGTQNTSTHGMSSSTSALPQLLTTPPHHDTILSDEGYGSQGSDSLTRSQLSPELAYSQHTTKELAVVVREKDKQLASLRETMEHNEKVIFKVYEERQQQWESAINELQRQHEQRLQQHRDLAFRNEQAFAIQLRELENDVRDSRREADDARDETRREKETNATLKRQLASSQRELEGVISDLRARLHLLEEQNAATGATASRLASYEAEISRLRRRIVRETSDVSAQTTSPTATTVSSMSGSCESLSNTQLVEVVRELESQLDAERDSQRAQSERWRGEKAKVVRFQRQLQLNYYQMSQRNEKLERELASASLELEAKECGASAHASAAMVASAASAQQASAAGRRYSPLTASFC